MADTGAPAAGNPLETVVASTPAPGTWPVSGHPEHLGGHDRDHQMPAARSTRLRYSRPIVIPAGKEWPACDPQGARPPARFRWLMVENRATHGSGNDALVSLTDPPSSADPTSWYMSVPAGTKRIRSVTGYRPVEATPLRLRILNIGAAAITLWVECDDEPIVDRLELLSP